MMNAYEMDAVVFRTAMSPGIREQNDMFPMIANLEGKMVVGQFGSFIHGFKEAYDGTIEEGDLFLTTDPYACNGAISTSMTGSASRSSRTAADCLRRHVRPYDGRGR